MFVTDDNFVFIRPRGKIVRAHALFGFFLYNEFLDVNKGSGSLNRIAVAGMVLGTTNVSGIDDENTDNIVAPSKPSASTETSDSNKGF